MSQCPFCLTNLSRYFPWPKNLNPERVASVAKKVACQVASLPMPSPIATRTRRNLSRSTTTKSNFSRSRRACLNATRELRNFSKPHGKAHCCGLQMRAMPPRMDPEEKIGSRAMPEIQVGLSECSAPQARRGESGTPLATPAVAGAGWP
jgi:hypothetical protein